MAQKSEPAWATRLRDLRRDFVAANKRSRMRFVLIQTIGPDVNDLQPSDSEVWSGIELDDVTLGDDTPAMRRTYRFGRVNDPVVALIVRGNDILNRHGDDILKLFGLKFIRTSDSNWLWLLDTLERVPHPFRGDMQVDRVLAGYLSPTEMAEAVAFTLGQGPQPNWLAERNKSFRADIPHVTVASIAAIRAILERVDADASAAAKTPNGGQQSPDDGPFGLDGFRWGTLPSRIGLASTPFRLLTALWNAKDRTAHFRDLASLVWDDGEINLRNDSRLGSARRAVNDFMEAGAFPFRVRTSPKNEVVTLVESTRQPNSLPKSAAGRKARRSPRPARQ